MKFILYKIFSRLFLFAFNYKNSILRKTIYEEVISNSMPNFKSIYEGYKKKYSLHPTFSFNGTLIYFYGEGNIYAGPNSYIGDYSTIYAHPGNSVTIGENVHISHNVRIYSESNIADQDFSITPLKSKAGDVTIGDNSWIGANVFINPGIKIGSNSVVGANSVVTKDVPDNVIAAGVPAKIIKQKTILTERK